MQRLLAAISESLIVVSILSTTALAQQARPVESKEQFDAPIRLEPFERFDGVVTLRTKDGQLRKLHVVIRNWIIPNRQRIQRFPEEGFIVVQLRGGELTTVIEGQRQERSEDEFWTVPTGASMSVQTGNESAIIQTMAVRNQ